MNNNANQNPKSLPASSYSELSWLAFCYVANELDAKTRREFEIRLEQDQTAREAVVQAFDSARVLNQALSQTSSQETVEIQPANRELAQSRSQLSKMGRSKSLWPTALLGLCIAGLLAIGLLQLYELPGKMEVADRDISAAPSELTNVSVSLAETWADSDWESESAVEIADIDTDLTEIDQSDGEQDLGPNDEQDDWMTATLIDMTQKTD